MRVYHVRTNRTPWGHCDHLERIDDALLMGGSTPLDDLDVGAYDLEADGEHYTIEEFPRFAAQLAHSLRAMKYPLIVSDSTIDWHNRTANWEWTGWASNVVRDALRGQCVVDVVCGSGFVARADHNEHFYTRISKRLRNDPNVSDVVLIGGWNDTGRTDEACAAIERVLSLVSRF